MPSVQFLDRMVDIPAACRSWYAQCTLSSRPCTVLWMVLDAPVVVQRQVPWLARSENCGVSAVAVLVGVVQFLDKVVVPVGATTVCRAMLGTTMDTCYYPGWFFGRFFLTIFFVKGLIRSGAGREETVEIPQLQPVSWTRSFTRPLCATTDAVVDVLAQFIDGSHVPVIMQGRLLRGSAPASVFAGEGGHSSCATE